METKSVYCPHCGRLNENLYLDETGGCFICSSCGKTVEKEEYCILTIEERNAIFDEAIGYFNRNMGTAFSRENVKVAFCTQDTKVRILGEFLQNHFPEKAKGDYVKEYLQDFFSGMAFCEKDIYGILLRSDVLFDDHEFFHVVLHELCHIYCIINEFNGENFYKAFCLKEVDGYDNGLMCAGYKIWREVIAEAMAEMIDYYDYSLPLNRLKKKVVEYEQVLAEEEEINDDVVVNLLLDVLLSKRAMDKKTGAVFIDGLQESGIVKSPILCKMVKTVFSNFHNSKLWEITPDFIYELGNLYIDYRVAKQMQG